MFYTDKLVNEQSIPKTAIFDSFLIILTTGQYQKKFFLVILVLLDLHYNMQSKKTGNRLIKFLLLILDSQAF